MSLCFWIPQTEKVINGKQHLFAANGKRKRQTSACFAADVNGKWNFVFLGQQIISGNWRLVSANVPIYAINQANMLIKLPAEHIQIHSLRLKKT
jgi:hypothetical protein